MLSYSAPTIVEFGNSSKLIKGSCGIGTENVYLNKTGYYMYDCTLWTYSLEYGWYCKSTELCADHSIYDC